MTGSSELSDALNPYFCQERRSVSSSIASPSYDGATHYSPSVPTATVVSNEQFLPPQVPPYTPHRSELADAINPAAIISSTITSRSAPPKQFHQPPADPIRLLKGLIQSIASYKAAVECEKKRRLTWEQEQEVKYLARQSELESRVLEMQKQIDSLKSEISAAQISPTLTEQSTLAPPSSGLKNPVGACFPFETRETEAPEQRIEFVQGTSTSPPVSRKRTRSGSPSPTHEYEPMKLRTHRDSRPQTTQAAMRNHILRSMDLELDKDLPVSHFEGAALAPSEPVRFVWDQTTKKSEHNSKMKTRIVADMLMNKQLYPLVPAQEFTKAKLDGVFEQAFTTLRQKYASQKGSRAIANRARERGDTKSRRARRMSRKKIKLANRISTRKKLSEYSLAMFDAAFQMDCMSSEESSEEEEEPGDASTDEERPPAFKFLRIRYLAWRSSRLHRLFQLIDAREEQDRSTKPKRGIGRKDRRVGLPKDGNPPPPKGVSRWMVSKKWIREAQAVSPKLTESLQDAVRADDNEVPWLALRALGEESDDEVQRERQEDPPILESLALALPHQQYFLDAQHAHWAENMSGYIDVAVPGQPVDEAL